MEALVVAIVVFTALYALVRRLRMAFGAASSAGEGRPPACGCCCQECGAACPALRTHDRRHHRAKHPKHLVQPERSRQFNVVEQRGEHEPVTTIHSCTKSEVAIFGAPASDRSGDFGSPISTG